MQYKLRLTAVNVVGASPPSEPTKDFQTIQAPPKHSPKNVTVRAVSATELRVRWIVSRNFHSRLRFINFSIISLCNNLSGLETPEATTFQAPLWMEFPKSSSLRTTQQIRTFCLIWRSPPSISSRCVLSMMLVHQDWVLQPRRGLENQVGVYFLLELWVLLIHFLGQFRRPVLFTWRPTLPLPPRLLSNGETCRKGMKMVSSRASKFSTELYPKSHSRYWIPVIL